MGADSVRIKGRDAIEWQAAHGGQIRAYADPIDDEDREIRPSEARDICEVDAGLVFIDVPEASLCPLCLLAGGHTPHDGGEEVALDVGNTEPIVRALCVACRAEHEDDADPAPEDIDRDLVGDERTPAALAACPDLGPDGRYPVPARPASPGSVVATVGCSCCPDGFDPATHCPATVRS